MNLLRKLRATRASRQSDNGVGRSSEEMMEAILEQVRQRMKDAR
jgi:hypothetical protein